MVTKVEGERDKLKGLVETMTREKMALCGRRDDLSREGERRQVQDRGIKIPYRGGR